MSDGKLNNAKILIVDDHESNLALLEGLLKKQGYSNYKSLSDPRQAVPTFQEWQPDLILLDLMMPHMDGFTVMQALRPLIAESDYLPILVLTADVTSEAKKRALSGGAMDFLTKPFDATEVILRVKNLLHSRALHRQMQNQNALLEEKVVERNAQLEQARRDLQSILDSAGEGIYGLDPDGHSTFVNPAALAMLGYSLEEMIGRPLHALIHHSHPDGTPYPREECPIYAAFSDGQNHRVEDEVFWRKDGSSFYVEYTSTPIREGKRLTGAVVTFNDITERKQAEMERQALLEIMQGLANTDDLQEFLKLIHHSIASVIYAENFFVVFYNKDSGLFEETYSVDQYDQPSPPSALEKSITSYVFRSGEPLLLTQALFDELAEQGEVELVGTNSESWLGAPLKTQNGTIGVIAVQHYEDPNRYTERDRDFLALIGSQVALAIERKQAEGQLNYHARLLRHINDAVIATDDQLHITAWNRAAEKMYGWNSEEVMGHTVSEILNFELTDEQRAEARELLKESMASRSESIYHRKDGRTIYVEANTIALLNQQGRMTGYVSVHRDITERKQAEVQAQLQIQRLKALRTIDTAISSSFDISLTLDILLDQVIAQLKTDAAAVLLFHPITRTLEYAASRGFRSTAIREVRLRLGEGYAGKAILERRIIHISNLVETDSELAYAFSLKTENFIEYYCVPLIVKGEVKGVLEIFHRSALADNPEWLDFLETLAGQAAIAIDNATLFENLQHSNNELLQAYDATIEGWSHALDLRDKETEGHTLRVTEMTMDLAHKFGFTDEQLRYIRWGALLHDIGKMGVPDSILLKPDKLTDEEWDRMKKHPNFAFEMLSPIAYLKSSLDIPYCHHEKWDGTGYPRGLKGEVIPLAARLFAVVDVWDALRSDRPYRKAWTIEKTLEHIQSLSGTHFDPKVVEYFLDIVQ